MKAHFFAVCLALGISTAQSQEGRIVTFLFAESWPRTTNTLAVGAGELLETAFSMEAMGEAGVELVISNKTIGIGALTIAGPGEVRVWGGRGMRSFKVTPAALIPGRVFTVVFEVPTNAPSPETNTVTVQEGEVAELLAWNNDDISLTIGTQTILGEDFLPYTVERDYWVNPIVAGPAEIRMWENPSPYDTTRSLYTWRIRPQAADPGSTQVITPSDGEVHVQMESSKDLVRWSAATNGNYSVQSGAQFFRLRLDK